MNLIPQFPLNLVVFPQEQVNLHIFEKRYQQLISDCFSQDLPFGIPVIQKNHPLQLGTTVKVVEIDRQYADGRMDIITKGLQSFRISNFTDPLPGKLYAGAEIIYQDYEDNPDFNKSKEIIKLVKKLYVVMKVKQEINEDQITFRVYQIVHKIGLSQNQEIAVLELTTELERQQFILDHLRHMLPMVQNLDLMKKKISMNGHFKNIDV